MQNAMQKRCAGADVARERMPEESHGGGQVREGGILSARTCRCRAKQAKIGIFHKISLPAMVRPHFFTIFALNFFFKSMKDNSEMVTGGYEALINERAAEVFDAMESRTSPADMQRLRDAFEFARKAHEPQKRRSGEPYILHPVAVARITAIELRLDVNIVIAAFLHDVVEDTPFTLRDIRERFGDDVASLVKSVTKPHKKFYEMSKQLDNFKQMLNAMQGDIRGILVKLADRLHNMRTLASMRADKQMKIAGETDYFYAPLATRLGLYRVKMELENLSFRFRCPDEYDEFLKKIANDKERNRSRLEQFTGKIRRRLEEAGISATIDVEYREPYSLWRKMRKYGDDYYHLKYRHFVNVVFTPAEGVSEKTTALRIYSVLTDIFKEKPGGISNYIDSPKENGYRSFHMKLLSDAGTWEEVHLLSEDMMEASQYGVMAGKDSDAIKDWLEKFRNLLHDISRHKADGHFIEKVVTSFYNDDIMVFTPKGHPVVLPQKATALDFAFEVHSELGLKAKYARISGRLASMKTVLNRGDVVEIFSAPDAVPDPSWVDAAMTYKAKQCLESYFARQPRIAFRRCDHCHPIPGEEVVGFRSPSDDSIEIHKRDCKQAISLSSQYGDRIVSVDFEENPRIFYPASLLVKGVDRYHLLSDIIDGITNRYKLCIRSIRTSSSDNIFELRLDFDVHSYQELRDIMEQIGAIDSVDEVSRMIPNGTG